MLVRAGPIRDEYCSLSRPMRGHLARSAMTAAHHSLRTRPPLLASVLAIVTPHSNIAVVLLSTIYNIYYIYYLLSTPELEQEHLQQIRYLNSLILRTNRISSSFTDADITSSDILVAVPSYPHPLSSQQILYTLLGTLSTPSRNREGAKYM